MNRKTFLKNSAILTTGISLFGGCIAANSLKKQVPDIELHQLDALALANLIQRKKLSPKELLVSTIQRIEAFDEQIGAISIKDFEAALKRAEAIDISLPFAGIPLLLKDGTDFGTVTRPHSSRFFKNYASKGKSPIIKKYEALGFNFIGYSKTPEFNNMAGSTEPLLFSPCRNPWNLQKSVGASSGGAAAAVAAGYVPLAHGTDGGGSLRIPASACGIFGFAPSQYRMLSGQLDAGNNLFTRHHALSRTVRDSATLFFHTQDPKNQAKLARLPLVKNAAKKRLRIGMLQKGALQLPLSTDVQIGLDKAATLLQSLGHQVEPFTFDINGEEFFKSYFILFGEKMGLLIKAVEQITGQVAEATELLEPWTIGMARDLEQYTSEDKQKAFAYITQLKRKVRATFSDYDLWMSPVQSMMPPEIGFLQPNKDYSFLYEQNTAFMEYTALANMVDAPAMSIPLHWTANNMPVGIHFAADVGQENRLLSLAFELERELLWKNKWASESVYISG